MPKPKTKIQAEFQPGDTLRLKPVPEPETQYKRPPRVYGVEPAKPGVSLNGSFYDAGKIYEVVGDDETCADNQVKASVANTFSELFEPVK